MEPGDLILSARLAPQEAERFLAGCGFRHPRRADRLLQSISQTLGVPEKLARLMPALLADSRACADADAMLARLDDLFRAAPNARNLLSHLLDHRQALSDLTRVLGASSFLGQTILRNPEYAYWLAGDERLRRIEPGPYFQDQAAQAVAPFEQEEPALQALRRFRRRESLRIAWQDVLALSDVPASVAQISHLADAVVRSAFGIVARAMEGPCPRMVVLGMGKLGGGELNFSSDIDLVYVYDDEESPRRITRFARRLTQALSQHSEEGRLYRVDLRLRPMGRSGEIVYSLNAFKNYFETWADTADRLAYLKCRSIAGDGSLAERFDALRQDFVFRRYLDLAAVEEIRWLKRRTDRKLREERRRHNLKLGSGGIREIEFFVQAFQLLHGAHHAELRSSATLRALDAIVDRGFVGPGDYRSLRNAYLFLRSLEHKLQLVEDRQTHSLPQAAEAWELFSRLMGYGPAQDADDASQESEFSRDLNRHRSAVKRIYQGLFEGKRLPEGFEEMLLNPDLKGKPGIEWLRAKGVEKPDEVHEGLRMLADAPAYPQSPTRLRNLLANLAPRLIDASSRSLHPARLFSRLDRLCDALASRAGLYQELVENPGFADRLFLLLSASGYLSEILIARPELLDRLSRPAAALPSPAQWAGLGPQDGPLEIRRFMRGEEFKASLAELFGDAGTVEVRALLSDLADACLQHAVEIALQRAPGAAEKGLLVLALGKLGGRELTLHSDLDLILVHGDQKNSVSPIIYTRFLKALREGLEDYTEEGRAYVLDFRLRPEGRHGSMVIPASAMRRYFQDRLQAWERLAYVKARPVVEISCPSPIDDLLWRRPLSDEERRGLAELRQRKEVELSGEPAGEAYNFKIGEGGLLDIQFVVQFLQLEHGLREPNTIKAIELLSQRGHLEASRAEALGEALRFLLRLEAVTRILSERAASSLPRRPEACRMQAWALGCAAPEELLERYRRITAEVRRIYLEIFG